MPKVTFCSGLLAALKAGLQNAQTRISCARARTSSGFAELLEAWIDRNAEPFDEGVMGLSQNTVGVERVLMRAFNRARRQGRDEVGTLDALAAFFSEDDSHALALLGAEGLTQQMLDSHHRPLPS